MGFGDRARHIVPRDLQDGMPYFIVAGSLWVGHEGVWLNHCMWGYTPDALDKAHVTTM